MEAPTLISPDYTKGFYIFSFASYDTVAVVLLQKDDEGLDHPIAFFNKTLRDVELKYDPIKTANRWLRNCLHVSGTQVLFISYKV